LARKAATVDARLELQLDFTSIPQPRSCTTTIHQRLTTYLTSSVCCADQAKHTSDIGSRVGKGKAKMAMFSQNPLMNGANYSFNEAPRVNAPEGARQHRFDP
jgi:hypothetical protein